MPEEKPELDLVGVIMELKRQEPFVPFSIVVTSGHRHLIESGDNLVEMRAQFFYATPSGEKFAFIRKSQIVAVEGSEPRSKRPPRRKAS